MKQFFENTKPGGQLLALGLIFVLFFILSTGFSVVTGFVSGGVGLKMVTLVITQLVSFAGTALLFAYLFYGNPLRHLGMPAVKGRAGKIVAAGLILICLLPMSDWLARLNDAWHLPQSLAVLEEKMRSMGEATQAELEVYLGRTDIGALIVNLLVFAFVPAVCEEMVFRGALQRLFCRMLPNPHAAIWLTAAVFSLFHGEIFAFLPRFVLGAALGYLFYYGGSLWINATAHFLNNALAIILLFLGNRGIVDMQLTDSLNAPWYLAVIGLAIAVTIFVFAFLRRKNEKDSTPVDNNMSLDDGQ